MRLFRLKRMEDVSKVSGTGYVAEGIIFSDGHVALRWITASGKPSSTVIYDDIQHVEEIHGHGGRTLIEYVDHGGNSWGTTLYLVKRLWMQLIGLLHFLLLKYGNPTFSKL